MIKLQFKDRRRESVWLVDQIFTIGKSNKNSLMIEDPTIEEHHAEIINSDNALSIRKKGTAKVKVNGEDITQTTPIKANDIISLGSVELELVDSQSLISKPAQKTQAAHIWSLYSSASWLEKNSFIISNKTTIGRDAQCDIHLNLDYLSRKHVLLEPVDEKLFIEDLNSSNGTFVNGERIKKTELQPGDKIKLDVLTFEVRGPSGKQASDPNKTIIRTAPASATPPKPGVVSKPSASAKPKSTSNNARPTAQKQPESAPPLTKKVQRKKLASNGKQAWISGDNQLKTKADKQKRKKGLVLTIIVLTVVIASLLAVFTL